VPKPQKKTHGGMPFSARCAAAGQFQNTESQKKKQACKKKDA
jgi:hypothetical protein